MFSDSFSFMVFTVRHLLISHLKVKFISKTMSAYLYLSVQNNYLLTKITLMLETCVISHTLVHIHAAFRLLKFSPKVTLRVLTCQLIKMYFLRLVFGSSTLAKAYIIFPLFKSSLSSMSPSLPVDTNLSIFVWPS